MAKQSINVSTANSGLGDPLRTAFVKINSNFTELYAALGLDAGGLNLGAFQFSGSIMSTTDSTPMVLNQAVSVTGDLTVGGDLLPNNDLQVNLGSPSKKWHSIYVGTGSVYIGDAKLSLEGGTLNSSVGFSTDSLIIGGNVLTVNESGVLQSTGGIDGGAGGSATDRLVNGANEVVLGNDGITSVPGPIRQAAGSYTRTSGYGLTTPSQVVWFGSYDYISSVKLTIQVEADETGDATGWHSQVCEAIIASRGYGNGIYGYGDPVITVYGVTYTSTAPLVTFTVQRNVTTRLIELVATKTAAAGSNAQIKIHSVEMVTSD